MCVRTSVLKLARFLGRDSSSIIVFGGGDPSKLLLLHQVQTVATNFKNFYVIGYTDVNMNDIFVLNLTSLLWSSPSTSNDPPPPRKSHQGRLYETVGFN
jgi:hypothetical protein